jgi:hypothetical protein
VSGVAGFGIVTPLAPLSAGVAAPVLVRGTDGGSVV